MQASVNGAVLAGLLVGGETLLSGQHTGQLYSRLMAIDFTGLQQLFTAFFASIPHDWYRNNPIARYEGYYVSVFCSHFAALGLDVRLEGVTNRGRIDMAVLFNGNVWAPRITRGFQ